jgi:predicted transcriptional regulator
MADAGFLLPIPKLSLPKDRNMAEETMRALTVQIVSAHIASNTVSPADLPKLINDVHQALVKAGEPVPPLPSEPAVPVRQSVKADHLVCLECGQRFSLLKRHLRVDHQTTPVEYRRKWGLPPSYPVVAPDYAKVRSRLAKKIGLGRLPDKVVQKGAKRAAR